MAKRRATGSSAGPRRLRDGSSVQSTRGRAAAVTRRPPPVSLLRRSSRSVVQPRTTLQRSPTSTSRRTTIKNSNTISSPGKKRSSSSTSGSSAAAKQQQHACSVEQKKPEEEEEEEITQIKDTKVDSDDRVPSQNSSVDDADKSRDPMTSSSDPDEREQTASSADDVTTVDDGQAEESLTADRKENSDESQPNSASSEPALPFSSDQHITITCGGNEALMYLGARTSPATKERSRDRRVLFNGAWLSPNEFQTVSGRGAAKDWKRTVKHHGQGIKSLLAARILSIDTESAGCTCRHCMKQPDDPQISGSTSGVDSVTSSSPETGSSVKAAARAKRKGGRVIRQPDTDTDAGGVVSRHGDRMKSSGVVKDEKDEDLNRLSSAAAAGPTVSGQLDDVTASKFDHLNRVIAELKRTKSKLLYSPETGSTSAAIGRSQLSAQGPVQTAARSQSHLSVDDTQRHPTTNTIISPPPAAAAAATPLATLPVFPFTAPFQAGFCGQLTPLQMTYPPYIFMGFPVHPQLLQSYPVNAATSSEVHQQRPVNASKRRKSSEPLRRNEPGTSGSQHSAAVYLPLLQQSRDHPAVTSSPDGPDSVYVRQVDSDGALDLTKK